MAPAKVEVEKGTTIEAFWQTLPAGTQERLSEIEIDGKRGKTHTTLPGVGRVEAWLDACSEGEDRGGYVRWYRLTDVRCKERSVVLESDSDEGILFADRMCALL